MKIRRVPCIVSKEGLDEMVRMSELAVHSEPLPDDFEFVEVDDFPTPEPKYFWIDTDTNKTISRPYFLLSENDGNESRD